MTFIVGAEIASIYLDIGHGQQLIKSKKNDDNNININVKESLLPKSQHEE